VFRRHIPHDNPGSRLTPDNSKMQSGLRHLPSNNSKMPHVANDRVDFGPVFDVKLGFWPT